MPRNLSKITLIGQIFRAGENDIMDDYRIELDRIKAEEIPEEKRCRRCDGTGNEFLFMYHECQACKGTGISQGNEAFFSD